MSAAAAIDATTDLTRDLRMRHQSLMNRNIDERVPVENVESFTAELIQAGAKVPPGRDRDRLRNMLFFWTAELSGRAAGAAAAPAPDAPDQAEPARALPSLEPYRGSGKEEDSLFSPDKPLRPSSLAERELSDAELAELMKTRTTLRIAALARQYKSGAGTRRKGYLLSGAALEEARSVMDRDPDIRDFVVDSDRKARLDKWIYAGLAAGLAIAAAFTLFFALARQNEIDRLVAMENGRLGERQKVYKQLRLALDQIEQGDPEPLRRFVKDYGDADDGERASIVAKPKDAPSTPIVQQLQTAIDALKAGDAKKVIDLSREIARPAENKTRAEIEQAARAPRQPALTASKVRPPPLDAPTAKGAPYCDGWLWLGSDQDRKVTVDEPLASLEPGNRTTVIAGDDLRLRAGTPSDDYTLAAPIGLVAVGSVVEIVGRPRAYPRPSGLTQYWAEVKTARPFCTRVVIQYAGGDLARLGQLRDAMITQGFVPSPEALDTARGEAQIRYFRAEDEAAAAAVAAELVQLTGRREVPTRRLEKDAPAGTIEVWIDLSLLR
jgi:hypothetical protein